MKKHRHKYKRHLAELSLVVEKEHANNPLSSYLRHHKKACISSLDHLLCAPFASLLTILVIAIALSLPVSLMVFLQNIKDLSQNWDRGTEISIYLKKNVTDRMAKNMVNKIQNNPAISDASYISPDDGLKQLQKNIGLHEVLSQLKENPLPGAIIAKPRSNMVSPEEFSSLLHELKRTAGVGSVQLDKVWVERLYFLMDLAKHLVSFLFILFGAGVILIIGNTIRLAMQKAHKEIAILKLLGASDAFVRRQFLYSGFFYGLFGSILSWVIVLIMITWMQEPMSNLMLSYGSDFNLHILDQGRMIILFSAGAALGLIGSWLGIKRLIVNY